MGKPARTTGLPYHLIYPLIAVILLSITAFAGADSVWYVSVNTQSETIRFSAQDYLAGLDDACAGPRHDPEVVAAVSCPQRSKLTQGSCGYNVSNLVITAKLGCIQRGCQWQIPDDYFGFEIPTDISQNLSKVAVTSVIAFSFVLAAGVHHAYAVRYSYRASPAPNNDKVYSLVLIHVITVGICFLFTTISFIAQAAIVGNATSYSGDIVSGDSNAVSIEWGQSPWLVLAAAVIHIGWGYEAVRWRVAVNK